MPSFRKKVRKSAGSVQKDDVVGFGGKRYIVLRVKDVRKDPSPRVQITLAPYSFRTSACDNTTVFLPTRSLLTTYVKR